MRKKYYKCLSHKFVDCLSMLSPTSEMSVLLSELDSDVILAMAAAAPVVDAAN